MTLRLALLSAVVLAGCPDPEEPLHPPKLWLSLVNGDETRVQLVPVEPEPF